MIIIISDSISDSISNSISNSINDLHSPLSKLECTKCFV